MPAMADKVSTAVRIPPELHETLVSEAERRDVSVNKVVEWALRRGLPLLAPLPEPQSFQIDQTNASSLYPAGGSAPA